MRQSRLLTTPVSALSDSGAVMFQLMPSRASFTEPAALSSSTRLTLS